MGFVWGLVCIFIFIKRWKIIVRLDTENVEFHISWFINHVIPMRLKEKKPLWEDDDDGIFG